MGELAGTALLDGLPLAIQWSPNHDSCSLEIAEPGQYALSISFVPEIEAINERNRIEVSLPAIVGGRFQLRHLLKTNGLEVIGVASTSPTNGDENTFTGELDGSGRIAVQWPELPPHADEATGPRVTELEWLDVTAGQAVLHTKFIVEGGVHRPDTLFVSVDGPWQLMTSENVIADEPSATGQGRAIQVALPPDDIDRQEVYLQWQLQDSRTLGIIVLPHRIDAALGCTGAGSLLRPSQV